MPVQSTIDEVSESHRIAASDLAVSFADPTLDDLPLTYVNDAFCALAGYARDYCLGRNCRFLQAGATEAAAVARVRDGIAAEAFRLTVLVNRRADGVLFDNALLVGPVRNLVGDLTLFFGMQWNLTETSRRRSSAPGRWLDERFEAQLARYEAMVNLVYRRSVERGDEAIGPALVERLIAMSRPQQYPPVEWVPNWTRADHLLRYLVEPYGPALVDRVVMAGTTDILAADVFTPLALIVHELASRSLESARHGASPSTITLTSDTRSRDGIPFYDLVWSESVGTGTPTRDPGTLRSFEHGLSLARDVVVHSGGHLELERHGDRLDVRLGVPNGAAGPEASGAGARAF